jgi:hypothetical protein
MNLRAPLKTWGVFIYRASVGFSERTELIEFSLRIHGLILNTGRVFFKLRITISFFYVWYAVLLSVKINEQYYTSLAFIIIIIIIMAWWRGLCGHMIPRAMPAVPYATGSAPHARQVKGDDPDKKGYPGLPGWGLGVRLTTPPRKKILLRNLKRKPRSTQGCRADDDDDDDNNNDYYYWSHDLTSTYFDCVYIFRLN